MAGGHWNSYTTGMNSGKKTPYLLHFPKVGNPAEGYISIAQFQDALPFAVQRVFWTYYTPEEVTRGRHTHHVTEQVLVAGAGRILVKTQMAGGGEIETWLLEHPHTGIYIPPYCWHTMQYSHNAVQIAFASTQYHESDYIRDYESFLQIKP